MTKVFSELREGFAIAMQSPRVGGPVGAIVTVATVAGSVYAVINDGDSTIVQMGAGAFAGGGAYLGTKLAGCGKKMGIAWGLAIGLGVSYAAYDIQNTRKANEAIDAWVTRRAEFINNLPIADPDVKVDQQSVCNVARGAQIAWIDRQPVRIPCP